MLKGLFPYTALVALVSTLACSAPKTRHVHYSDFDIRPVSTSNPYLGSNVHLSQMMERSPYFYNFIANQGAPRAITVVKENKYGPQKLQLYYPNHTMYRAEAVQDNGRLEWLVNGPYQTNWRYGRILNSAERAHGEPVLHVRGQEMRFKQTRAPQRHVRVLQPVIPPEPKIIVKEVPVFVQENEEEETEVVDEKIANDPLSQFDREKNAPLNTDQQALLLSQGYAARDNNGDILHTKTSDKEKFIAIVNWYTGSTDNTNSIINANPHIEDIHAMENGTKVRIPYDFITEFKLMPIDAVYEK